MLSTLFTLPAFATLVFAKEVFVTYRYERSSGRTALEIQGADKAVLAESCSSKIGSLDFSNLEQDGRGFFTVGDKKFEVLSNPEDGPVCTRIYDEAIAVVECTGVDYDVPESAATSAEDCFFHEDNKAAFRTLKSRSENLHLVGAPVEKPVMPPFHSRILGSRQACMFSQYNTKLVGDGNPHQNYLHKQLSSSFDSACGDGKLSEPYVLKSPNNANRGGSYYCVVGTCRSMGDDYWDDTGRAGGP
ncbi:hypothetical protein SNOG_11372 [Parastagonospora nodorum SN15]|uniref:AA1-like domain-containing protein n=1 Tax=Phaeosphaeria nodorum (strain SN15 / ATCC MYA-4574 / FGSC 10173) TaxID=321614 RepID=Q0UA42_PHANO|nr:hypothetical protein SNOG_11372 [Parastagonospora nodorum SN15]EAT81080.2 hypothetical protein SNOG_11372 [Parastagonospora nodorum SN15]